MLRLGNLGKLTTVERFDAESTYDPVRMYLRLIGRITLVIAATERELARKMDPWTYIARLEHELLASVLDTLNEREQRVLQLRFGLEDGRSKTLAVVAREFGVTQERIRQIEAEAIEKLRHPIRAKKLRSSIRTKALRDLLE